MKITVVICTKDRREDLAQALLSVGKQTRIPDEVIIVDASSNKDIENDLSKTFFSFDIKYFYTKEGLTKQRNIGVKNSFGDIIVFLDDDIVLDSQYIFFIEKIFIEDKNREIGGAMGKIINLNKDSFKYKLNKFYSKIFFLSSLGDGRLKVSGLPAHPFDLKKSGSLEVEALTGAQMSYRREVFKDYKFDEYFSSYSYLEDVDFSHRIFRGGYKLVYQPQAMIEHKVSKTGRISIKKKQKMFVVNHFYIFKKNCDPGFLKWLIFIWSHSGMILFGAIFFKKDYIFGIIDGWLQILKSSDEK